MSMDLREKISQAKQTISSEVFTTLTEDDSNPQLDAAIFHLRNMKQLNNAVMKLDSLESYVNWLSSRVPPTQNELAEARAYRRIWREARKAK